MELTKYATRYTLSRSVCRKYSKALIAAARELTQFVGGALPLESLESTQVNEWLQTLETASPHNASNKKRRIGTLWRSAFDEGLAPPVGRLRKIKLPRKDPEALTADELKLLLAECEKLSGNFRGTAIPRRLYFASLFNAYYDTALRLGDLRSIEVGWIWPGGTLSIVQSKTNRSHQVQLSDETQSLIQQLVGERKTGLIWGILNCRNFGKYQRKLFKLAGIRGTGKWIRRTSASYVELHNPGMGWRHLGHAAPGLAERFYIDPRIVRRQPTLPPKLTG